MGKIIVIPRGFQILNSDIGDYTALLAERTYEFTNIKMSAVRTLLGESTYSLKNLALSSNINKWAAFKPNRLESDDGMYVETPFGKPGAFGYRKPNDTSGYRLGQFACYNHNATAPFFDDSKVSSDLIAHLTQYLWSSVSTVYYLEVELDLPEWDIRGYVDGSDDIDRLWCKYKVGSAAYEYTSIIITNTMITNREINIQVDIKPQDYGFNNVDEEHSLLMEFYLGNANGDSSGTGNFYCHFPTTGGGLVSATYTIGSLYYYNWEEVSDCFSYDPINGIQATSNKWIRQMVKKTDDSVYSSMYYEDDNTSTPLNGTYKIPYGGNENYHEYTDGVRGEVVFPPS